MLFSAKKKPKKTPTRQRSGSDCRSDSQHGNGMERERESGQFSLSYCLHVTTALRIVGFVFYLIFHFELVKGATLCWLGSKQQHDQLSK